MRAAHLMPLLLCLCLGSPGIPAAAPTEAGNYLSLNPAEHLIQEYEDPGRSLWQKPEKVVDYLMIKPGELIADIGAGSGYFSMLLAKATGAKGTVYASDTDREMISYLQKRALRSGLNNIRPVLAKADDPQLPEAVDLVFICNTYMFIDQREQYLARLKNLLKKDGRLAIISFDKKETPEGPPLHTRVSREKTLQEAQKAGFKLEAEYFFLPYQHFLVFVNK